MKRYYIFLAVLAVTSVYSIAQPPGGGPPGQRGQGGRGGFGGPGGQGGERPSNAVVAAIDSDGDHTITAQEIQNAAASLKALDKNRDGQLTSDEVHGDREGGRRGQGGPPGAGGPGNGRPGEQGGPGAGPQGGHGPGPGGPPTVEQFMSRAMTFDADKDGMLNQAELQKMAAAVIEEMSQRGGPPGGERGPGGQRGGRGRSGEDGGNRQRPDFEK